MKKTACFTADCTRRPSRHAPPRRAAPPRPPQVLISDAILQLRPDFFWLGGGEVDLKLGFKTSAFLEIVKPFVCDCTV